MNEIPAHKSSQGADAITAIADIPRVHARIRPTAIAAIFEGRSTDYATLDRRTSAVANGLIAFGVRPQTRVAYLGKNSDSFFEIYFGAAKVNVVMTPVNWRLAQPELSYILDDSKAAVLFITREYVETLEAIRSELPNLKQVILLDARVEGYPLYETWLSEQKTDDPKLPVVPSDVVIQLYTSGTTGRPKGAQLTNGNVLSALEIGCTGALGKWGPDEIVLIPLPMFHVGAAHFGLNAFYHGGQNFFLREADPTRILAAFSERRITRAGFVPAVIQLCLEHPDCATTDFSALHMVTYGGSPIPLELLIRALNVFKSGFMNMYGMTESSAVATALGPKEHVPDGGDCLRSVGKALPGMEVRVVRPDGTHATPREVGEIIIRGPAIFKSYWNLPEATAKAVRNGWYHSGDAGYFDEGGYLYIHDRLNDMIISGGENVYPAEVESAIFGHPAVKDVAVIGVPDDKWGEAVKALVVPVEGATIDAEEIIAHARKRIASYKLPKTVDVVEVLPRNPAGKILKRELRKPYWEGRERQVN